MNYCNVFLIGSPTSVLHFPIHPQSSLSKILTWPWNCTTQNPLTSSHHQQNNVKILLYRYLKSSKIWTQIIFATSSTYPCIYKTTSRFRKFFPFHMTFPTYFPPPRMPFDLNCICPSFRRHLTHLYVDENHLPTSDLPEFLSLPLLWHLLHSTLHYHYFCTCFVFPSELYTPDGKALCLFNLIIPKSTLQSPWHNRPSVNIYWINKDSFCLATPHICSWHCFTPSCHRGVRC